jgi:alpha-tubulin suppressor-like RCC1 family protein
VTVVGGLTFATVSAGFLHTCGVTTEGAAYCWGLNGGGHPVAVVGGLTFGMLSTGGGHTCGITTEGAAYCWGDNRQGQLGLWRSWAGSPSLR